MQSDNRLLDDLARVFGGAAGVAQGVREDIEGRFRQQFDRIASDMNLVRREDFEVVRAMAEEARLENERLRQRIEALEARLSQVAAGSGG